MSQSVKPVPEGAHTVTPHLVVSGAAKAIEFYKRALGAEEKLRMAMPDGTVMHAEIRIGDSNVMLSDEMPPMPGQPGRYKSPVSAGCCTAAMMLYVSDCDAMFARAVREGCTVRTPMQDMFWGDRYGQVIDPFGHTWAFATHKEDVSVEEMKRRQQAMMTEMAKAGSSK
jgi:PhnB protein